MQYIIFRHVYLILLTDFCFNNHKFYLNIPFINASFYFNLEPIF